MIGLSERSDEDKRVGEQCLAAEGVDQRALGEIVHPGFVSRDEDVGARALFDLAGKFGAGGEVEDGGGVAFGGVEIADLLSARR